MWSHMLPAYKLGPPTVYALCRIGIPSVTEPSISHIGCCFPHHFPLGVLTFLKLKTKQTIHSPAQLSPLNHDGPDPFDTPARRRRMAPIHEERMTEASREARRTREAQLVRLGIAQLSGWMVEIEIPSALNGTQTKWFIRFFRWYQINKPNLRPNRISCQPKNNADKMFLTFLRYCDDNWTRYSTTDTAILAEKFASQCRRDYDQKHASSLPLCYSAPPKV